MSRKRGAIKYSIACYDELYRVDKDRVFRPEPVGDAEEEDLFDSLVDEWQFFTADEALIALRQSFSATFSSEYRLAPLSRRLLAIRRKCTEAAKSLHPIWSDLGLSPIPIEEDDRSLFKARLFSFILVRNRDLETRVSVNGQKTRLSTLIGFEDATDLLRALRAVVSDTFTEVHTADQIRDLLWRIRCRIWIVLPPFNVCLGSVGVEPIAHPTTDDLVQTE